MQYFVHSNEWVSSPPYVNLCFVILLYVGYILSGQSSPRPVNGPIRLWRTGATSRSYSSGLVQIVYNGQWGNICGDGTFGLTEAEVICHQLGFTGAVSWGRASSIGKQMWAVLL